MEIKDKELVEIFRLFVLNEKHLNMEQLVLYKKLEDELFSFLSIEEVEKLHCL
jgi:Fe-S cluster biosynthesis and repair protein YggX